MKVKYFLTAMVVLASAFLMAAYPAKIAFCGNPTPDGLVEEGKGLLINHQDIYAADAKFVEALGLNSIHQKANFWRAITVISSNPDLKDMLTDLGIIGDGNDGDPTDDLLIFDDRGELNYGYGAAGNIIIDDKDTGGSFIVSGDWVTPESMPGQCYKDSCLIHAAGASADKVTWIPNIQTAGDYRIWVWLPANGDAATNAQYIVNCADGNQPITLGQRGTSGRWANIGRFRFATGQTGSIELSDNANGPVIADAVKLEFDGVYLSEDPTVNPNNVTLTGQWTDHSDSAAYGGMYKEIVTGTGGKCEWTFTAPATGKYVICAYWGCGFPNRATDAIYEIKVGQNINTIPVNQQRYSHDRVSLGLYELAQNDIVTVTLFQNATGEVTADGLRIVNIHPAPNLSEGQFVLTSSITQINQALGYLDNVTNIFQDTADLGAKDDNGNPVITELDYGDALMLKALLNLMKTQFNVFAAYDMNGLDVAKLGFTYQDLLSVNYILNKYLNLGKPAVGASAYLSDAKQALIGSINAYKAAYSFIISEQDDQNNDFITFDPEGAQPVCNDFVNPKLDEVLANLTSVLPTPPFITILTTEFPEMDSSAPYYKIALNLRAFFDNPINFRAKLPTFGNDNRPVRSSVVDLTFGGLLPNMTEAELNGILQAGPHLWHPCVSWNGDTPSVELSWEKDTYTDFSSYNIYRSTTEDVGENPDGSLKPGTTLVATITNKDTTAFTDTTINSSQITYYYRLYTYYSTDSTKPPDLINDKAASEIRRVITKVYVNIASASGTEDGSPEHPYKLLGDGIDAAGNGAKICVAAGTYSESAHTLNMWNIDGIVLEGGYNAADWTRDIAANETIIDAAGSGDWACLGISNVDNVTVDGFTIKNAQGNDYATGISLWHANSALIKNCKITNCNRGIDVGEGSSSCTLENCVIQGRKADGVGHEGISLYHATSINIKNCSITDNKERGITVGDNSSVSVRDCYIAQNGSDGIFLLGTGNSLEAVNNLVADNGGIGIICNSTGGSASLVNNTIVNNNGSDGIYYSNLVSVVIKNNIITNNNGGGGGSGIRQDGSCSTRTIINNDSYGHISANYNNCGTDAGLNGNISADPLFIDAANGNYHLSQAASGQGSDSPSVNTGSDTAANLGLSDMTTRTDNIVDSGIADMGYHYVKCTYKRNDIIIDFGDPYGIWIRYNDTYWTQLHNISPESMVTANLDGNNQDEIIIDFGGLYGIWIRYNNSTWAQLHNVSPESMVTGDLDGNGKDEVIIDFGDPYGIWIRYNDTSWAQLHNISPESMVTGDLDGNGKDDIVVDFGATYGIWIYHDNGTWTQLHNVSSKSMVTADLDGNGKDDIIIDFGPEYGIWIYHDNGTWTQLHNVSPESMVTADLDGNKKDDIIIDFGNPYGIWIRYNDTSWTQLHNISPESMVTADLDGNKKDDIIIDFGDPYGIWIRYNDTSWTQLHNISPESMVAGSLD